MSAERISLSRKQLRELFEYDQECAFKYMSVPIRKCKSVEPDDDDEGNAGASTYSQATLDLLKDYVKDLWTVASTICVMKGTASPDAGAGLYLEVRPHIPVKFSFPNPGIEFGWIVKAPDQGLPSDHLYERSPVSDKDGSRLYMGGPVSYMNWCVRSQTNCDVHIGVSTASSYKARLITTRSLTSGTEMKWTYGSPASMPEFKPWFLECCYIGSGSVSAKRHERRLDALKVWEESCSLCGKAFSTQNKEKRVQRKPHLTQSHADFLGSTWDGRGEYRKQSVCADTLLVEANVFNDSLSYLMKDMKGRYTPACKVFTARELQSFGDDQESLMDEFKRRELVLLASGVLVFRGINFVETAEDLKPVMSSQWKTITWKGNRKPCHGMSAVPESLEAQRNMRLIEIIEGFKTMCGCKLAEREDPDSDAMDVE